MDMYSVRVMVGVFVLNTISTTVLGQCDNKQVFFCQLEDSNKWRHVVWRNLSLTSGVSPVTCAGQCLHTGNECKAFALNSVGDCILLGEFVKLPGLAWTNSNGGWTMFRRESEAELEFPVFRVSSKNGISVYNAWMSGPVSTLSEVTTSSDLDLSSPLTSFYKHPLVDDWQNWNKTQAVLSLYTNGQEVVRVQLNAADTSATSWFSLSHLITSPWSDLDINAEVNYFSLTIGAPYEDHFRRFYINSHFGGCDVDRGWLMVLDGPDVCSWTQSATYPTFNYAKGTVRQTWNNGNQIGTADDLVIAVRVRL